MKLAELNVAYAAHDLDSPKMADFMDNLDRVNALAERSPGYVWRLQSDSGNATDISVPDEPNMLPNMSLWDSVGDLGNYVFNTVHARFYERRAEWFKVMKSFHFVMWYVEDGHIPTLAEAMDRLAHLDQHGSSDHAFGWDYVDQSAWRRCAVAAE
ncbi:hypothetical protein AIOL_000419 [Candidatus Rhodobacter oscarellae]|uniref:DUF3291 domain-containing protein n=1 Tax=Candidatus Rhodobacter oscarellae TaxID=1675527 RepID=A0A0J9ECA2_9RHOB|nr:DUF3291 domain-containing protein [Candidatus Rhodobacter lobularis]KMW60266.1 hypothetical protein AIOL_000419 [Candidatus Rhodobacter lobularis]